MTWARRTVDVDSGDTFAAMEKAAAVSLIATFDPELVCCSTEEDLKSILSSRYYQEFDFLPVRQGGRVVGLLERGELAQAVTGTPQFLDQRVSSVMRLLAEEMLIGASASLFAYIENAKNQPCRLVVDEVRISGIVTISDLHKLPVRPALFFLVTHLEMLMAEFIRTKFGNSAAWITCLDDKRARDLDQRWDELKHRNMNVDKVTASQFCEKRDVILQSMDLPMGKNKAHDQLRRIEELRNHLAHAGDYAADEAAAYRTVEEVQWTRKWISYFATSL